MVWQRKVVWTEGMFLLPQHFQQQERYLEFFAHQRALAGQPFYWGFGTLELNREALAIGRIVLTHGQGIMPDGTPFSFPDQCEAPAPFDVPPGTEDERIVLAMPIRRPGAEETDLGEQTASLTRYRTGEAELRDTNTGSGDPVLVQYANPKLALMRASDLTDGYMALGVAHVVERRPDNQVTLDRGYIPPILRMAASEVLASFVGELNGLLHQRSELLTERLSQAHRGGISEVADFLMLQLVNRWAPWFAHHAQVNHGHPENLYGALLQLAGELSTFARNERRPPAFEAYRHDDLRLSYEPLMAELRRALSMVLEQNAIAIELHERSYGIRVAVLPDAELVRTAQFVLAVHADLAAEHVRSRIPAQTKIGPVDRIRDLVNLQLPGVGLRPLPVVPRQIPYHAGYHYFELDTGHDLWKQIPRTGSLAMHIAGEFPALQLEFWAIRP